MHEEQLASEHPRIAVDPDMTYLEDRGVATSAGTAADFDAACTSRAKSTALR